MSIKESLRASGFEELPRFRIFDEHSYTKKGVTHVFDKARLERIANRLNTRDGESGSIIPVIVGHTKDDAVDEKPIVGYLTDHRVEKHGRKWFITSSPWAFQGQKATFQKYPRRSVEIWISKDGMSDDIDPVSLLGGTAPQRDELGVHLFHREKNDERIHYSRITDEEDMNEDQASTPGTGGMDPAMLEQIVAAVFKSKPMMKIIGIVTEIEQALQNEGAEHDGPPGEDDPEAPPSGAPAEQPPMGGAPDGAAASGPPPEEPPQEQRKMSREDTVLLARMQRDNEAMHARLSAMENEKLVADIDRNLDILAKEVVFDRAEERKDLLKMSREGQAEHFLRMKTRYEKKRELPNGGQALHGSSSGHLVKMQRAMPEQEQVVQAIEQADMWSLVTQAASTGKTIQETALSMAAGNSGKTAVR